MRSALSFVAAALITLAVPAGTAALASHHQVVNIDVGSTVPGTAQQ